MTTFEYPTTSHYSKNFPRRELDCRCGCVTPEAIVNNLVKLAEQLELLRSLVGLPLQATCGYRCKDHNKAVGGVDGSEHTQGKAADVWVRGRTPVEVKALAEKVPAFHKGGIGLYGGWVHVDIRSNGPARWNG